MPRNIHQEIIYLESRPHTPWLLILTMQENNNDAKTIDKIYGLMDPISNNRVVDGWVMVAATSHLIVGRKACTGQLLSHDLTFLGYHGYKS